jgi:hypothetical protein
MEDFASREEHFYGESDGQAVSLFFLSDVAAARVNALAAGHVVLSSVADWVHDVAPARRKEPAQRVDSGVLSNAITSYVSDSRAIVPYDISKRFAVNDQLSHPVFGVGIVVRSEHTQIDVLLDDGMPMLAHARNRPR